MSTKELAIQDIKEDLKKQSKYFIPFHNGLNPVMRKLVIQQLRQQGSFSCYCKPSHANSQLVAHCFFAASGKVKLHNYSKYYNQ